MRRRNIITSIAAVALVVGAGCGGGKVTNQAPTFITEAGSAATVYHPYFYEIGCVDSDGDTLTITRDTEDSCGGVVTDNGNRTGRYEFTPAPALGGDDCQLAVVCSDGKDTAQQQVTIAVAGPMAPEALDFPPFAAWDEPLTDYITAAASGLGHSNFMQGIHDLIVHEDRLYLGYGDANLNVGRHVPIDIRYYESDDPTSLVVHEFDTDEEQVERYRILPDGRLALPGVDATEDDFMGNAYLQNSGGWAKSRTLSWAWHVHDIAGHNGDVVACGSGGDASDYADGTVNALLFRSTDGGTTFDVDVMLSHPDPPGDQRFTSLLNVDGTLYVGGYYSDYNEATALVYRYNAGVLEPWSELPGFWIENTLSLTPSLGLVFGVAIDGSLNYAVKAVRSTGVTDAAGLAGRSVLDAVPFGDGRVLLLTLEGDSYPAPDEGPWEIVIGVSDTGAEFLELTRQTVTERPAAVAFWRRSLYLGFPDGSLWRSDGALLSLIP